LLWEILVPCVRQDGRPFHTRYHRVWDAKVRAIAGGLTILHPAKGQWVYNGAVIAERVIPVRVACTREQIEQIVQISLDYYEQIAIMAYKISDEVIL